MGGRARFLVQTRQLQCAHRVFYVAQVMGKKRTKRAAVDGASKSKKSKTDYIYSECLINDHLINYVSRSFLADPVRSGVHRYKQQYSSSTVCFYDCHEIPMNDRRYGMPCSWNSVTGEFKTWGCFCSLECVRAYVNESCYTKKDQLLTYVALLGRKLYGKHTFIRPAPPKYITRMFGGHMSIYEYRQSLQSKNSWVIRNVHCGLTTLKYEVHSDGFGQMPHIPARTTTANLIPPANLVIHRPVDHAPARTVKSSLKTLLGSS